MTKYRVLIFLVALLIILGFPLLEGKWSIPANYIGQSINLFVGIALVLATWETVHIQEKNNLKNEIRTRRERIYNTLLENRYSFSRTTKEVESAISQIQREFGESTKILDSLSYYWKHLNTTVLMEQENDRNQWNLREDELYVNMLYEISNFLRLGHHRDYIETYKAYFSNDSGNRRKLKDSNLKLLNEVLSLQKQIYKAEIIMVNTKKCTKCNSGEIFSITEYHEIKKQFQQQAQNK